MDTRLTDPERQDAQRLLARIAVAGLILLAMVLVLNFQIQKPAPAAVEEPNGTRTLTKASAQTVSPAQRPGGAGARLETPPVPALSVVEINNIQNMHDLLAFLGRPIAPGREALAQRIIDIDALTSEIQAGAVSLTETERNKALVVLSQHRQLNEMSLGLIEKVEPSH